MSPLYYFVPVLCGLLFYGYFICKDVVVAVQRDFEKKTSSDYAFLLYGLFGGILVWLFSAITLNFYFEWIWWLGALLGYFSMFLWYSYLLGVLWIQYKKLTKSARLA